MIMKVVRHAWRKNGVRAKAKNQTDSGAGVDGQKEAERPTHSMKEL